MWKPAVVATLLTVTACAGQPSAPSDRGLFFPRHDSPLGMGDAALLEGELQFADGCVWVGTSDGSRFLVLWPSNTGPGVINSLPAVLGPGRELLAETGEVTQLGGSETDLPTAERLVGEIPDACSDDSFWVVSTVENRP